LLKVALNTINHNQITTIQSWQWRPLGDKGATFRDEDGSITMLTSHQQIVKPGRFYTNSLCELRDNWDMAICPFKYANPVQSDTFPWSLGASD
jgi:hypothetical protein